MKSTLYHSRNGDNVYFFLESFPASPLPRFPASPLYPADRKKKTSNDNRKEKDNVMTRKTQKYSKGTAGFTLIELMVTVALVALLSAISLPGILSGLPEKRLRSAARDLYSTLQKARLLAVKINREVRVEFNYDNSSFVIDVQENAGDLDGRYAKDEVTLNLSDYGGVSYGTAGATADWEDKVLPPADPTKLVVFTKTGTVNIEDTVPLAFPVNIYLDNESQTSCYAVSVEIYGSSRILRYSPGSGWGD
ncbi:MAG: prepilin-type N-terminal cleavage/methylation domain-containing protein [Candidatus Electrothrix sp. GM3_4]|nr:prepilin-type N-terminal cleavage/methylation domain-containing protein [Candidatus Electrothrix sp. GM3_4]